MMPAINKMHLVSYNFLRIFIHAKFYEYRLMKILLSFIILTCSISGIKPPNLKDPTLTKINDTLYAGISEVTVYQWKKFLLESRNPGSFNKVHRKIIEKDSLYWKLILKKFGNIYSDYFLKAEYNMCPAIGISYEDALAFCKWVTENVASNFKDRYHYTYRLPSEQEWEIIALCENKTRNNFIGLVNTSDVIIKETDLSKKFYYRSYCCHEEFRVMSIDDSYKTTCGLVHIKGNVSEMVNEKNIAKGGSYKNKLSECNVNSRQQYSNPELWLGFRYIVIRKKI